MARGQIYCDGVEDYCYIYGGRRGSFLLFAINYRDRCGVGERTLACSEKFYDVVERLGIDPDTFLDLLVVNRVFFVNSLRVQQSLRRPRRRISVLFDDV